MDDEKVLNVEGVGNSDWLKLDDYVLERELRGAISAGDRARVEELREEARRRFAGMLGLPESLMEDRSDGHART